MKKIIIVLVIVIIVIIGGYLLTKSSYKPSTTSINPPPAGGEVISGEAEVKIQNFAFNPVNLTIKKGTTVKWTNEDSVTHTIKSDTFNSGNLNKGSSYQFQFNNSGTYNYSCGIHPSMTGQIIVQD